MPVTRRQGDSYVTADAQLSDSMPENVWDIRTSAGEVVELYGK